MNEKANELFDRLYGQPREDLDEHELKVINDWLSELLETERKAGYEEGILDSKTIDAAHDQGFSLGRQAALDEAAKLFDDPRITSIMGPVVADRIRQLKGEK